MTEIEYKNIKEYTPLCFAKDLFDKANVKLEVPEDIVFTDWTRSDEVQDCINIKGYKICDTTEHWPSIAIAKDPDKHINMHFDWLNIAVPHLRKVSLVL